MAKFYSLLIAFAASLQLLFAQSFEWAASGSNLITGYSYSAVSADGRLIAGGNYATPSYSISQDEKGVYDGSGKLIKLPNSYNDQFFITCFSASGAAEWTLFGSEIAPNTQLKNVCARPDGNVVIAFTASSMQRIPDSFYDEEGLIPAYKRGESIPDTLHKLMNYRDFAYRLSLTYLAEYDVNGQLKSLHAFRFKENDVWYSFECSSDGTMYFTTTDSYKAIENGKTVDKGGNFIVRIDQDYTGVQRRLFQYLSKTCCSYTEPGMICTISDNGELFAAGTFHTGLRSQGMKDFMVKDIPGNSSKYHFNSYVVKLDPTNLSIQWIKFSESFTLVKSITASDHQVVVGGRFQFYPKVFGMNLDSTESKKAFMMAFDYSGKPRWSKSFNAEDINSLSHDFGGHIYASFHSKQSRGLSPLKIGTDTISDTFERIVVASFDRNGDYRWSKKSNSMMSNEPNSKLHCDPCGNIYFTGEMWYVLPVNMSLFDAAFVSGKGYGGAPVAAKIRTTIPDELIALNTVYSKQFILKEKRTQRKESSINQTNRRNSSLRSAIEDSLQSVADSLENSKPLRNDPHTCIPIPFSWTVTPYPNPVRGALKIKCITSYSDTSVSIEIRDSKGSLIRILQEPKMQEAGEFTIDMDCSDLSAGVYIVVLKGSMSGATARFVVSR